MNFLTIIFLCRRKYSYANHVDKLKNVRPVVDCKEPTKFTHI